MTEKTGIQNLDIRIAIAVVICFLSATACSELGFKFTYGEMHLEILQKMTACIACLLCVQDNTKISRKAGVNRMIITAIGGIIGIGAAAADNAVGNPWFMTVLIFVGILLTLLLCKMAKVPYINARIGGVTGFLYLLRKCQNFLRGVPFYIHILRSFGSIACFLVFSEIYSGCQRRTL